MFGQLLDKLDTVFGRAFLLSRYAPWLLCAAVNLAIAVVEFPALRPGVARMLSDTAADRVANLVIAMLVVWVVAYVTSPLVPFVTTFLEGETMPDWMRSRLATFHVLRRDEFAQRSAKRMFRLAELPRLDGLLASLRADRLQGSRTPVLRAPEEITRAAQAVDRLLDDRRRLRSIQLADFSRACAVLAKALRENCADRDLLLDEDEKRLAARLQQSLDTIADVVIPYVQVDAGRHDFSVFSELTRRFGRDELAATQLGNDVAALRYYSESRYGIDFGFFWPRFLLVLQKDSQIAQALSTAKTQFDFSVLCMTLSLASVAAWALFIGVWGTSALTALLVIGIGPVAVFAWLQILHGAYAGLADLVRSAMDLSRFDVLAGMRHPLPANSKDEKACWEAAQRLVMFDEHDGEVDFERATR